MTDPTRWAVLGRAISEHRERQGLTQKALAALVQQRGGKVTERTIITLEAGTPPKSRAKPLKLEVVVAALGWKPGWTDRILAGEDPNTVLQSGEGAEPVDSPRAQLLELAPHVYEFGRIAARLGAPPDLRDAFDQLVRDLLDSVSSGRPSQSAFGLASYRPHAEGEGVPPDDAARIRDALNGAG